MSSFSPENAANSVELSYVGNDDILGMEQCRSIDLKNKGTVVESDNTGNSTHKKKLEKQSFAVLISESNNHSNSQQEYCRDASENSSGLMCRKESNASLLLTPSSSSTEAIEFRLLDRSLQNMSKTIAGFHLNTDILIALVAHNTIVHPDGHPVLYEFQFDDHFGFQSFFSLLREGRPVLTFCNRNNGISIIDDKGVWLLNSTAIDKCNWIVCEKATNQKLAWWDGSVMRFHQCLRTKILHADLAQIFTIGVILQRLWHSKLSKSTDNRKSCRIM